MANGYYVTQSTLTRLNLKGSLPLGFEQSLQHRPVRHREHLKTDVVRRTEVYRLRDGHHSAM